LNQREIFSKVGLSIKHGEEEIDALSQNFVQLCGCKHDTQHLLNKNEIFPNVGFKMKQEDKNKHTAAELCAALWLQTPRSTIYNKRNPHTDLPPFFDQVMRDLHCFRVAAV
jgi:hypothetical protein